MKTQSLTYGTALVAYKGSYHHVLGKGLSTESHICVEYRLIRVHRMGNVPKFHDTDGAGILNLGRHGLHEESGPSSTDSSDAAREQVHVHHFGMLCTNIDIRDVQRVGLELRHHIHHEAFPHVGRIEVELHLCSNLGDVAVHIDINQTATGESA